MPVQVGEPVDYISHTSEFENMQCPVRATFFAQDLWAAISNFNH